MNSRVRRKLPASVEEDLQRVCRLIEKGKPSIAGRLGEQDTAEGEGDPSPLAQIAGWLYQFWYCASALPQSVASEGDQPLLARADLSSALRVALAASATWENDWIAMYVAPDGRCMVGRRDERRELVAGEYANLARPGCPLAPGDLVAVRASIDWNDGATGFWYAQSAAGVPEEPRMRVYFSVRAQHVGEVLHEVTDALDGLDTRYLLKCPMRPRDFGRVDSLIFYLERETWPRVAETFAAIARRLSSSLRSESPPLTCVVTPGMSYAQDPGGKQSFGESRCNALAAGVLHLLSNGYRSRVHAREVLVESLCASGIDPCSPWDVIASVTAPELAQVSTRAS